MQDTSLAEESPIERARDLLDFDGETAIRRRRRHRGVDSALLPGPEVPDALVAIDAASFPGVWRVDIRGHVAQDRVYVPDAECLVRDPARSRSSRSTAGMLRNLPVARRERSRLAPPSRGGPTAPFAHSPRRHAGDGSESRRGQPHAAGNDRGRATVGSRLPRTGLCDA